MRIYLSFCLLLVLGLWSCGEPSAKEQKATASAPPNIIYILADDLGYGDLRCYGQQKIRTPYIDRMAKEGLRFTQHYSGSTVCAPSRSVLMTGLHTGHTFVRGNREVKPEGQHPMPDSAQTLAELMKEAGYRTGAFGKWGLGFVGTEGDPNRQGFDEFYGYNCQREAHRYYPTHLWHNEQRIELPGNDTFHTVTYAPDLIQEKTLEFIERHQAEPFFLYVPIVMPHAELIAPEDSILASYRGTFPEGVAYKDKPGRAYGPGWNVMAYCPQDEPRAVFASMVSRVDLYVGQILSKLKSLGIDEQTLVVFSSDNGPHEEGGADPDFFGSNGPFRGHKRDLYEGGIRVPMIARWPGKIAADQQSEHPSAFWDVMPTFIELAGGKIPYDIDGISFVPTLLGDRTQLKHPYLYWEFHEKGGRQAIRQGKWKAVRLQVFDQALTEVELYDLSNDPSESTDLADQHPAVLKQLEILMDNAHQHNPVFTFDGGR